MKKTCPVPIEVLDGQPFALENITEETQPLKMTLGNYILNIVLIFSESPANPMVLGLPWFELHNFDVHWHLWNISWRKKHKGKNQVQSLFLGARASMYAAKENITFAVYVTLMSTLSLPSIQNIHPQYQDFNDVFEKKNANLLPKH